METIVKNNLEVAQRGGVPGTFSLVEAYLNVRKRDRCQYQVEKKNEILSLFEHQTTPKKKTFLRTVTSANIQFGPFSFIVSA